MFVEPFILSLCLLSHISASEARRLGVEDQFCRTISGGVISSVWDWGQGDKHILRRATITWTGLCF